MRTECVTPTSNCTFLTVEREPFMHIFGDMVCWAFTACSIVLEVCPHWLMWGSRQHEPCQIRRNHVRAAQYCAVI